MQRARIGEVELEYEVRGEGDPLLLIHGAHIADAMRPLALEPALEGFQRITYHRRGYAGSSPVTGPVAVEEHADDAAGLLGQLGVPRAHVGGHSSGGLIALGVALRHPVLVESLILLEPPLLDLPAGAAFIEAVGPLVERFEAGDAAAAVHDFLAGVGGDGWRTAIDRTVPGGVAQAERDAATFFTSELPGTGQWRFGRELAAQISVPVLSVLGGASAPLFAESHKHLVSWLERAEEATIPGATHLLQMEQPAAIANAIAAFCLTVAAMNT